MLVTCTLSTHIGTENSFIVIVLYYECYIICKVALKTEIVIFHSVNSVLFYTQSISIKKHYNLTGAINEYELLDPLLSTVCDSDAFC